jgi:hypothetical protein
MQTLHLQVRLEEVEEADLDWAVVPEQAVGKRLVDEVS